MSEAADIPEADEPAPPAPIDTLHGMTQDLTVRSYLIAGLAALAMIFLVLLSHNSDIGGLVVAGLGAMGMILRWPAAPSFFLILLLWFLVFPFGYPPAYEDWTELRYGSLRLADMMLAVSVVVYLACHYRVYALTTQALPLEPRGGRKRTKPVRRPASIVRKGEIPRLLWIAAGVALFGQVVWYFTTHLEIDVLASFPLQWGGHDRYAAFHHRRLDLTLWHTRLIVLLGLGFFGSLLGRLIFGYWRLRQLSAAEGAMILQDSEWSETHRERVRLETWRAWIAAKLRRKRDSGGES
jgi:hypothetical protein